MPTPSFIPQTSSTLTPIRYYQPYDPYFYTIDNRPLQDIYTNLLSMSTDGADSARRAVLVSQLGTNSAYAGLFTSGNTANYMDGMSVTLSGSSLTIGAGALYISDVINADISTQVTKQALNPSAITFTVSTPGSTQSIDYLIQAEVKSLTSVNMPTSRIPFLDSASTYLPGLLLNGEAVLTIKAGTAATSGSQVTPTVDSGKIPLYVVTLSGTASNNAVKMHSSAPAVKTGSSAVQLTASNTLPHSGNPTIAVPVSLKGAGFSPNKPIKATVLYTSDSSPSGTLILRTQYRASALGDLMTASYTTNSLSDTVTLSAAANALASMTLTTSTIPTSAFAGFVSNKWAVNREVLFLNIQRVTTDSHGGIITVHEVQLTQ